MVTFAFQWGKSGNIGFSDSFVASDPKVCTFFFLRQYDLGQHDLGQRSVLKTKSPVSVLRTMVLWLCLEDCS